MIELAVHRTRFTNGAVDVTFDPAVTFPEPLLMFSRTSTGEELLAESREHFWAPTARYFQGNRYGAYEIHHQFAAYQGSGGGRIFYLVDDPTDGGRRRPERKGRGPKPRRRVIIEAVHPGHPKQTERKHG